MKLIKRTHLIILLLTLPCILCGQDEVSRLRRENQQLREQIIKMEQELTGIRQWLGSTALNNKEVTHSARESRLLFSLKEFSRRGNDLAMNAMSVSDEFRKILSAAQLNPARKARIQLQIGDLERSAQSFSALSIPGSDTVGDCRVLAVNRDLNAVVISVGSGSGVMPGMVFHHRGNRQLKLQVSATRFDGALAEIISGSAADFPPGTGISALTVENR